MEWIKGLFLFICLVTTVEIQARGHKKEAKLYLKGRVPKVARVNPETLEVKANHPIKVKQSRFPASVDTEVLTVISE